MGGSQGVATISDQQSQGRDKHRRDGRGAQRVLAKDLQDVGQERNAGANKGEALPVHPLALLGSVIGQMAEHHDESDQPDREVHEEDQALSGSRPR